MHRQALSMIAAAALAFSASQASADTVELTGFQFNPPSIISVDSAAPGTVVAFTDIEAGEFAGTRNGASFLTYCTELTQEAAFGITYNDYNVVSGVTAWGAAKSLAIDHLMSAVLGGGFPTNADQSVAIQAAIWEILYETGPIYDFSTGSFTASSINGTTQGVLDAFDFSVASSSPITVHVDQFQSPSAQDFLVVTEVPEPSTYALMFAGLVGMGFVARRRQRQR
jgi:PEP-CTERM motif